MSSTRDFSALIDAYLNAPEREAADRLDRLCETAIYPLALQVVRAKLSRSSDDVDDVVQVVVTRLAVDLRRRRLTGNRPPGNGVGWVVASAINACCDHFRDANRPRTQLANAVRYILGRSISFKTWTHLGRKVCGWHRCAGTAPLSPGELAALMQRPAIVTVARLLDIGNARSIRRLLARVFALAHGGVQQTSLVPTIVEVSGLPGTLMVDRSAVPDPVAAGSADEQTIQRSLLELFWTAAMALQREQRLAVMLHLSGRDGIHAFWERGAVSRAQVAAALSLTEAQLDDLPWSDLQIADFVEHGRAPAAASTDASAADRESKRRQQRVINWRRDGRRSIEHQIRTAWLGSAAGNVREPSTSSQ